MRGLGDYQRAQMKRVDPRISQLFDHLRSAVDILEQMAVHPYSSPEPAPTQQAGPERPAPPPPPILDPEKLAYTVKDVRKLIGVSHAKLYRAMQKKELRAVKCGHRTLIMAKDLHAWINAWPER